MKNLTPVRHCSTQTFSLGKGNIVIAKKGPSFDIWTPEQVLGDQKQGVIDAINAAGFGDLKPNIVNTNFGYGYGPEAIFRDDKGHEVRIVKENDDVKIEFSETSAWSWFYYGTLEITSATGWIVKNTYNPKINIDVTKNWIHNGNNNTPESVQVKLYADGVAVDGALLALRSNPTDSDKDWKGTFENLPKYSSGTTPIVYTVAEVNVPNNYTPSVTGDVDNGFTITNTYTSTSESGSGSGSNPGSKPESKPIRDTVTIEIGNNGKTEEANPDTGAPLMFAPVMAAALAAAVVVKRKK